MGRMDAFAQFAEMYARETEERDPGIWGGGGGGGSADGAVRAGYERNPETGGLEGEERGGCGGVVSG